MTVSTNIVWHSATITRADREKMNSHKSAVLWFTGLSGSGKSTLSHAVEDRLYKLGCRTYVLDGDNIRHGLCQDLGFSDADRTENIRRIGEVSKLLADSGVLTLSAFVSPFRSDRDAVRELLGEGDFIEIYCKCDLSVCEDRDVKGLYKKARAGEIPEFTGINSPYEEPLDPEVAVDTAAQTIEESVEQVINVLVERNIISLD